MITNNKIFSNKQLAFKELFVGTLIYAVVLGFFNDYTNIVYAKSFSTIFLASLILEFLTYLAFMLKNFIVSKLKNRQATFYKFLMFFSIWLVMFLSKFLFVWVLDIVFGNYINVTGFFGILLVVVSVTLIHKIADLIFIKLGNS